MESRPDFHSAEFRSSQKQVFAAPPCYAKSAPEGQLSAGPPASFKCEVRGEARGLVFSDFKLGISLKSHLLPVNSKIRATSLRPKTPSDHNFFYSRPGEDLPRFRPRAKHEFFVKFMQHRARVEGRCVVPRALGRPKWAGLNVKFDV